ncbi:MAG: hypothetical protein HY864_05175 [Chloroflexi bacterium]|nr:hypothetical protein [Chloroflexota bacterium]
MKIKISIFLAAAVFLSSCEIPGAVLSTPILPKAAAAAGIPSGCISPEPVQGDIDRALGFTDDIFSGSDWVRSYTVESSRVFVTFAADPLSALAFVEALIFPCGYAAADLDAFFNAENWQVIFENYESYEAASECKSGESLRLYQFDAVDEGYEYKINYWALSDTDTRVMGLMTVFLAESKSLMDEYSSVLFPELASCK